MFNFASTFRGFNQWLFGPYLSRPVARQDFTARGTVDPNCSSHDSQKNRKRKADLRETHKEEREP